MKFKNLLLAATVMIFSTTVSADLVIDLEGQEADGAAFNIFTVNNADSAAVTDLSFDFVYDAGLGLNSSWGSELVVQVVHVPTGEFAQIGTFAGGCAAFGITCAFDLMWDDAAGLVTGSGNLVLSDAILDGSGAWEILVADSFDDAGVDGVFLAGSNLTVGQVAAVPAPGALMLIGIGIAGLSLGRRRSAQV